MPPLRLLLADDHAFIRASVASLCRHAGFQVVGEAATGQETLQLAADLQPDVVLLDVQLPDLNGVDVARQLLARQPTLTVVMLTLFEDDQRAQAALQVGARGFLLKSTISVNSLMEGIRAAYSGLVLLDAQIATQLLSPQRPPILALPTNLTPTEVDLLRHLAQGENNHQMALALGMAEKTVANRLNLLYPKIGVANRVQAARYALEHGLGSAPTAPTEPK